jgi:hypothetical protein
MWAATKGGLIYARNITKNIRREQKRIKCLRNGGTWAEKEGDSK